MGFRDEIAGGATLAEAQGMTQELGRAIAGVASAELHAGRVEVARRIVEGLAVTNPHEPAAWALLALIEKRRGRPLTARICGETAHFLAPEDPQVRLVRAEVLLAYPAERSEARAELEALSTVAEGAVAARARALLAALGPQDGRLGA